MATDFAGTNTERIDKVVGAVIELRTTVRLCLAAVGVGMPLALGLLTFLVAESFGATAKAERLGDRIDALEKKVDRLGDRLDTLEKKVDRLGARLDIIEKQTRKP